MLFYTFLFIACIIIALVILSLYNAVMSIGRKVYSAILPSSKDRITDHLEGVTLNPTINDTPTPWGWQNHATPMNEAKTHPALPEPTAPWGWPGNNKAIREHGPGGNDSDHTATGAAFSKGRIEAKPQSAKEQQPMVGWPYREEKFDFAGKEYTVKRKAKQSKTNLSKTGKPWGW